MAGGRFSAGVRTGEAPASISRAAETASAPFTAADLGFAPLPNGGWQKPVDGRLVAFRPLRRVPELLAVETLQREIFGFEDRDLLAASVLVTVHETGGEVIVALDAGAEADAAGDTNPGAVAGADRGAADHPCAAVDADRGADADPEPLGVVVGWGGYRDGRPILVSDLLGVRRDARGGGLGAELKKLQAAVALARGFPTMTWTVDPLRAPNARLNLEKLGAVAERYEEDRYGAGFGTALYGDLPTDRLHVTWPLDDRRVRDRLLGRTLPTTVEDVAGLPRYAAALDAPRALVPLPPDVDRLLADDPAAALRWRLLLRETLSSAFDRGFAITGFVADPARREAFYVVERDREPAP